MLYGISKIHSNEIIECEYKLGAFTCVSRAEYEFKTDVFTKKLCKTHLEEYRSVLLDSDKCFDESIISSLSEDNDL